MMNEDELGTGYGFGKRAAAADAVEEQQHHDLTIHAVRSHDSSDDGDDNGDVYVYEYLRKADRRGSRSSGIISRLRPRDTKFQKLQQVDDEDTHTDDDNGDAARSPPRNMAQDVRRREPEDNFDNESNGYSSPDPNRSLGIQSRSTSFDDCGDGLDLDDTDLEYGITRYSVPASVHKSRGRSGTSIRTNGRGSNSSKLRLSRQTRSTSSLGGRIAAPIMDVVERVKFARAEARRKRAEQLLALPDDGVLSGRISRTRISVCFSNWCDMSVSDRGVILVAVLVAAFVAVYKLLDEEEDKELRRSLLVIGIPIIVLRFTWRYIWWFVYERRRERRRKITMQVFDGLNSEQGTAGIEIPAMHDDDEFSVASSLVLSVVENDADDSSLP